MSPHRASTRVQEYEAVGRGIVTCFVPYIFLYLLYTCSWANSGMGSINIANSLDGTQDCYFVGRLITDRPAKTPVCMNLMLE